MRIIIWNPDHSKYPQNIQIKLKTGEGKKILEYISYFVVKYPF